MDLTNKKVRHTTLGVGIISKHEVDKITVEFASKKGVPFVYPDAFLEYLKFEDASLQNIVQKEMDDAKEKKSLEENTLKIATTLKKANVTAKPAVPFSKALPHDQPDTKMERISGKRMTFYVFQGKTFDIEYKGGYLWAPTSSNGKTFHHWDRMCDIRPGDIILHGFFGYVQAISIAKGGCYNSLQPLELRVEDLWDRNGRRVDCDYIVINYPIKTSTFIDDILHLNLEKFSPFNKNGTGNQGYLYELNRELARIFIQASIEQNPELGSVQYIKELLGESNAK